MTKDEALEIFLWIVKAVYTNHRKLRTYLTQRELDAFHLIYERLNEVGREFAEAENYLGLSFHPYYPIVKDKQTFKFYLSHYFFHKWIESYLTVLRRIETLRLIVELHENEHDYKLAVMESWESFKEPITYEENAQYAAFVQSEWERLQSKQLELFKDFSG